MDAPVDTSMGDVVTAVLGVATVVITVVRAGPQAWRLLQHPEHVGVSVLTWAMALMTGGLGCSYGIFHDEPANLVANALQAAGAAAVLSRPGPPRPAGGPVGGRRRRGREPGGRRRSDQRPGHPGLRHHRDRRRHVRPQAARAVRAPTTAGISAASWWLVLVAAVIWSAYGVAIGRWVVVAPGFIQLPAGLAVLWRLPHRPQVPPGVGTDASLPDGHPAPRWLARRALTRAEADRSSSRTPGRPSSRSDRPVHRRLVQASNRSADTRR